MLLNSLNQNPVKSKPRPLGDQKTKKDVEKLKNCPLKIYQKKELIPARCKDKITKSGPCPLCPKVLKGGYKVQPVPTPPLIKFPKNNKKKDPGKIQKENLLTRG